MTEWMGSAAPGSRPRPEDDATRQARHDILATLLGAYADGELPPETMAQVEAHLLGCERCRREVAVHQTLAEQLATVRAPEVPGVLLARLRAATVALPARVTVAPSPGTGWWTPRIVRGAVTAGVIAIMVWGWQRARPQDVVPAGPAPVMLSESTGILASVVADYRQVTSRDLPGRARDLEAVRAALAFPVTPIRRHDLRLVAAWTTEIDGEPAAVLAYRWQDRLVLQYALSDAALFRAYDLRRAFSAGQSIGMQRGGVGLLGWSEPEGGAILVGDVTWNTLRALTPRGR